MIINWLRVCTLSFISIITCVSFSQVTPISYNKFLCPADLLQDQIICLNERIVQENAGNSNAGSYCYYSSNFPNYLNTTYGGTTGSTGMCPGVCMSYDDNEQNTNAYYKITLTSNRSNDLSITRLNDFCWKVNYLDTGNFIYSFNIITRFGREIQRGASSIDTTYYNSCGENRVWKQITVNISSNNICNVETISNCNLVKNPSFENYTTCPTDNNPQINNINYLIDWDKAYSSGLVYPAHQCGSFFGFIFNNTSSARYPPQPLPSGGGYIHMKSSSTAAPNIAQLLDLCANQKYKFKFSSTIAPYVQYPSANNFISLKSVNTISFPSTNPTNLLVTIPSNEINLYYNWHEFSRDFIAPTNSNGIIIENGVNSTVYLDDVSITPIDTVTFNTQLIGNRCDSAEMILNIPGCYGPYNLEVVVNTDTLNFLQVQDGYSIRIPLAKSNIVEVLSITNNLGCSTILSTKDTLTVQNGGDARFTSSDFCENESNTITFLADTGLFSLVNNGTSSTIDANTGIIINPQVGSTYIIQHAVCLDTIYDTITAISSSSDFTSSDICVGGSNVMNITGNTGGIFSLIPPINGATINASTGIVSGGIAGNSYTIQYKVTQGNCPDSTRQTIQVVAIEDPSFTLTDFCVNDKSNRAMVTGSAGGTFSFSPAPMDTATINAFNGFISGTSAGTTYTVQYVTSGVCKDSSTQTVTALALPTAYTFGVGGDLCTNDSIPLSIALTGASPWNISYTNGSAVNVIASPYTIYAKTIGDYSVTSISDANGCVNVGEDSIVKITGSDVQVWSNDTLGCAPQEVRFYTNIAGLNGDCLWDFGDGSPDTNICDSVTHSYQFNGNFAIKLIVSSPKCKDTVVLNNYIKVNPNPQAIFFFTPENPSVLNNRVEFTNNSIANVKDYWYLGNNFVSSIVNPEIILPAVIGNHEVCLEVENTFGCLDTACSQIFVLDESLFYIPNAFIPNNDGLNDVFKPVISNSSKYKMEIFNRWGKMIFETIDETEGWDGTYKGVNAREDLYVYRITYRFKGNFDDQYIQGHFNLLR